MQPENPNTVQPPQPQMFSPDNPSQSFQPPNKDKNKTLLIIGIFLSILLIVGVLVFGLRKDNVSNDEIDDIVNTNEIEKPVEKEKEREEITPKTNNDSERKEVVSQIASYAVMYSSNNNGKVLQTAGELDKELTSTPGNYAYPLLDSLTKKPYRLVDETPKQGEVQYKTAVSCTETGELKADNSTRNFVVRILLTNDKLYCVNA